MDFNATLAWNDPTRKGAESEWPDLERTGMRQFCDFHSTEQQILANPELQAAIYACRRTLDIPGPRIGEVDVDPPAHAWQLAKPLGCVSPSNDSVESI